MKRTLIYAAAVTTLVFASAEARRTWHTDGQYAGGEWKIQVQTPPCDGAKNIQVLYPEQSGMPITIECDSMPVPTK